ncbi:response regulator [Candidatus Pacearchaeota archaeon]|nr:response regulator [Candidatus Pacearchaeota archaeon]
MKPRALFGDDDESLRKAFNRFLSMKGFDVDEASTPNELIESTRNAYTNNRYGVIITDLNYEDYVNRLNGIEAIKRIREFDKLTPIILQSGMMDEELVKMAIESGANYAFPKLGLTHVKEALESLGYN